MSQYRDTVTAQTALTEVQAGRGPARDTVLLGKYRVESTLGFGGMGIVVQAHNLALDEKVAIKFLREDVQIDDEHIERFLREAKAAVRLKSEHVARIRDVGTLEDGRPYMVMELLDGVDLGKLLVDVGSLAPARAVELLLQTCDAIAEAHSIGIVHRDIKPTNLFLTHRRDDSDLLKVLDFGISKVQGGPEMSLTQTSSMLGTPAYMSPEQMRSARTVDPRSDIWALGVVLYELVEGRPPFAATSFAELCVMVSTEPFAPLVNAPQLTPVIERCLAKTLDRRYQHVGELAADLQPFASDPAQAQRQIGRILRVLGTPGAASRDSTPYPMMRDSRPLSSAGIGATLAPTAYPRSRSASTATTVLLLVLLFGVGIAGGLYVTSGDDAVLTPATTTTADDAAIASDLVEPPAVAVPTTADAGVPSIDAALADAALADAAADATVRNATERTVKRPPPRRPPPRRTPRPPPPEPEPEPEPEPAPVETCDPFDNPKGCR